LNDFVAQLVEQLTFEEWKGVLNQNYIENWKNLWGDTLYPKKGRKPFFQEFFKIVNWSVTNSQLNSQLEEPLRTFKIWCVLTV